MCPTQCKHSSILVERGETKNLATHQVCEDIPTAAHTFPAAALGLAAALAIRPRNPQEQGIPTFASDQRVLYIKRFLLCKQGSKAMEMCWSRYKGLEILKSI